MGATLKDLARETGLSVATISKYMNGATLREKNRVAVERAVKKLDYTVNEYARGLKSNKSRMVGVVIPELSNLFVTQIITKIEELLRAQGYSVVICDCHSNEALECEAVRFLLGKRVDALLNMPVCGDGRHLDAALTKEVPVVLLDRIVPHLSGSVDSVLLDNAGAAGIAVRRLLELEHRNIGIIAGPSGVFTSCERLRGYRAAFEEFGEECQESLVDYGDYTVQGGYESMCRLLDHNPGMTGVFVTNYEMTLGAVIALNDRGVTRPGELSFIGFDNLLLSRVTHPKLTIVSQPLEEMGEQAARMLLERMEGRGPGAPISIALSAQLLDGASVARLGEGTSAGTGQGLSQKASQFATAPRVSGISHV